MKFYAVAKGRLVGVFEDWNSCQKQVAGFSGAIFKSFKTKKDAENFIKHGVECESIDLTDFEPIILKKEGLLKRKIDETTQDNKKQKTTLNIFTDGGCSKNGSIYAAASIGVYFEGYESKNISKRIIGKQTNNRAELTAISEALKNVDSDQDILIHTDSEYSIKGITGVNKIIKNGDLFDGIKSLISKRTGVTKFKKVLGHSGARDGNYYADLLATKALQ